MRAKRSSLADEAYSLIRARIIDGRLPPGSRINIGPIAVQLELSATPIKAALVALEQDGLVVNHLHRGFYVHELSSGDMHEIYDMREALDSVAAQRAAGGPEHTGIARELRRFCTEQRDLLRVGDVDGYRSQDVEFHRTLWVLCRNSRILRTGETMLDQMPLVNSLSVRQPGRGEASVVEHFAIVEAVANGDTEAAHAAARHHIQQARIAFEEALLAQSQSDLSAVAP